MVQDYPVSCLYQLVVYKYSVLYLSLYRWSRSIQSHICTNWWSTSTQSYICPYMVVQEYPVSYLYQLVVYKYLVLLSLIRWSRSIQSYICTNWWSRITLSYICPYIGGPGLSSLMPVPISGLQVLSLISVPIGGPGVSSLMSVPISGLQVLSPISVPI